MTVRAGGASRFVTVLGARHERPVRYSLDGKIEESRFAGVALARLRPFPPGSRVIVVTTAGSAQFYEDAAVELRGADLDPSRLDIPDGSNEQEILRIFELLTEAIPEHASVAFDLTHGFRHLPFISFAALLYLEGLRGVSVASVHYGAFEMMRDAGAAPFIDLSLALALVRWYHALQLARDHGDFRDIAGRLREDIGRLAVARGGVRIADLPSTLQRPVENFSLALASGLPLEASVAARGMINVLGGLSGPTPGALPARLALHELEKAVQDLVDPLPEAASKKELTLTVDELQRELRLVRWYIDRGDLPVALQVMREWMVNAAMYMRSEAAGWLDFRVHREPAARFLESLALRAKEKVASAAERELGSLWKAVSDARNEVAHAGFKEDPVQVSSQAVQSLAERCGAMLAVLAWPTERQGPAGRLLVTPLGLSPGVLYSAVRGANPDRAVVITSAQGLQRLPEALDHAGKCDLPCHTFDLQDPHRGIAEVQRMLKRDERMKAVRERMVAAGEVVVNLTGGTTALQYAVERIAGEAVRLGCVVRRFLLVDRRDPEAQRLDPYVEAELVWLDGDEEG